MGVTSELAELLEPVRARPRETALLLDLDGTLAPIVERPDAVAILPQAREALAPLRDKLGLVAFVSGRSQADLRRIVGLDGAAYSGNHGQEILMPDGRPPGDSPPVDGVDRLARFASTWPQARLAPAGVWLEDKGLTLTFHYRTAPDPDEAQAYLDANIRPAAESAGLLAEPGRMSLEIRPTAAVTKGTAARRLLGASVGIRLAVSLGDDRTDVDVWTALRDLVAAGMLDHAVSIGVTSDETPVEVRREADALVAGPSGTADVLAHLV